MSLNFAQWLPLVEKAVECRRPLFDEQHTNALRLYNGFTEGWPELVIDLYADTVVIFDYSEPPQPPDRWIPLADWLGIQIPWIKSVLLKVRNSKNIAEKRGILLSGSHLASKVCENGVWYALDLTLNQDASLYLDTRFLRIWLREHALEKDVLNTFAYTGSLGIAAAAAGARKVVQSDLNQRFLAVARQSATLNGIPEKRCQIQTGDFFSQVANFKRSSALFDIVIADPPFFSSTSRGQVNLVGQSRRVINKLRPLVRDDGWLVSINNALFVSGADYLRDLEDLCKDGYLSLETTLPVPEDFTGYAETRRENWPADPAPFNHPTKIAILRVTRKSPI
ncbi:MAG TPA: class I SAM-dependent methyltransferase [Longilinea sp.]|nr:class I SAM-dependent methyltransferase [Longilinea sp.]